MAKVLIIGSGGAGLVSALSAQKRVQKWWWSLKHFRLVLRPQWRKEA